jgi:salicylate hydroxylase
VSITPNGGRILEHWGFDTVKAGGIENIQVRRPKGDTLEPMAPTLNFADVEKQFGNKWYFYHRVDAHRHLREMAEAQGAVIRLGAQVMDVEVDTGVIELKDGSKVQKDLVVVADGQHDRINSKVTGKEVPMQRSGQTAYRCLIPMKDILEDEETKPFFEGQEPGFWAPALPAKGVMAVTYPCRDNTILNVIAVYRKMGQHTTSEEDVVIDDWNFPATHEDLERVLDGFHPSVKKLFLKSPEVKVYTQMKRPPLETMTKGKTVLVGDASHPMLLTHAQGVSSSLEDAAALELFLADLPPSASVESAPSQALLQRLKQFEKFRLPRVSATQILTEPIAPGPKAGELFKKQEDEIRKYYSGPLPATGAMPHSPPICQFFFSYDVRKEAIKFMQDNPISTPVQTPAPIAAPVSVPAPEAAQLTSQSAQQPATAAATAVSDEHAMAIYQEAQKALAAAQNALVQVNHTLAAAQNALDLATKNLKFNTTTPRPPPPPTQPQRKQSQQKSARTVAQGHATPNPPTKPRRLKSFDSMKARMAGVGRKMSLVSVRQREAGAVEVTPPETPPASEKESKEGDRGLSSKHGQS